MTELKKCPFCGGEAIKGKNGHGNWIGCSESECYVQTRVFWTEEEAVQAWNARAADENPPLAMDELLKMSGQPIYVKSGINEKSSVYKREGWQIADRLGRYSDKFFVTHEGAEFYIQDYGKAWVAYRKKPEGADEEN